MDEINNAYPNDERSRNIIKKYSSIIIESPKKYRLSTLVDQKEQLDSYTNTVIIKIMNNTILLNKLLFLLCILVFAKNFNSSLIKRIPLL